MANELDETNGPVLEEGRDVNVIQKQIPVKTGWGSVFFQVILWVLLIIPGIIFTVKKVKAKAKLQQIQQAIQASASQIDNYLEQRVMILKNAAQLINKAVALDKDVMTAVAGLRAGVNPNDDNLRNEVAGSIDAASRGINVAFESYPELKAHQEIADAMQQNSYLQKEITAAREVYNDQVLRWNQTIFHWPTYAIVASKEGYTTRIPFTASKEIKEAARGTFFE